MVSPDHNGGMGIIRESRQHLDHKNFGVFSSQMTDEDDSTENNIASEPLNVVEFPGFSNWQKTRCCCTTNAIKVDSVNGTFLGHWEVSPGFPIAVSFIIISSYLIGMILILPTYDNIGLFLMIPFSILFFLFIYSYFRIITDGPGYFPFYWPNSHISTQIDNNDDSPLLHSDDLSPSGIISSTSQTDWVKNRERPPRCILSASARRLVVRPDHLCGWTSTWIGKRNHKFFILFNSWGAIYITFFSVIDSLSIYQELQSSEPSPIVSVYLMYIFLAVTFLLMTASFACSQMWMACHNVTSWEEWNNIDPSRFDTGSCLGNCEDICGPKKQWYLWFLPVSPWEEKTNDDLIKNYSSYK